MEIKLSRINKAVKEYWGTVMITVLILMVILSGWYSFPTAGTSRVRLLVFSLPIIFILAAIILFGVHLLMRPKKTPADTDKKDDKKPDEKAPEKKTDEKKKEKDDKKGPKKLGTWPTLLLSVGVWIGVWVAIWLLTPDLWGWFTANPRTLGGINLIILLLVGIGFIPLPQTFRVVLAIGVITLLITSSTLRGPAWSVYHQVTTQASHTKEMTKFKTAGRAEPTTVKAPKAPSWSELVNLPISDREIKWSGQYKAEVVDEAGKVVRIVDVSKPSKGRGDNDFHDLPSLKCRARFQSLMPWGVEIEIPQ